MLTINSLTKFFDQTKAVNDATFAVAKGELICLLGPSGCGKSTLLRMIAGLTASNEGTIEIEGRDVTSQPANRRPTAMVFQSHALWNHMNVEKNVAFGLRVRGLTADAIARKVAATLKLVGLEGFGHRRPSELSGGQAQRVALARCLVVEPKVLLMDEPFSALDAHLRKNLREELKQLQDRLELTTIFVTHDQEEAMELADRIVVMNAGNIEQIGVPSELYLNPRTLTVANFIGAMNSFDTTIAGGRGDWLGSTLAIPVTNGPATILCRPEHVIRSASGAEGKVIEVVDLGPMLRVVVAMANGTQLVWLCVRDQAPARNESLKLAPTRLQVYREGLLVASTAAISTESPRLVSVAS